MSEKGVIVNPEKTEIGKTGEKLLRSNGWRYVQNLDFDILVAVDDKQGTGRKREFGNARATPYIFFKTLEQLEHETKEEAKTHYWTADSLENHLTHLRKYQGGVIGVKLVANTVKAANTKNLRMIIQDSEGNEIQRQQLGDNIPNVNSAGGYVKL